MSRPVILGGKPLVNSEIPISRPSVACTDRLLSTFEGILRSGRLTKGVTADHLEGEVASYLGAGHAVAVSTGTTGLMLLLRCLGVSGEVVLPSFTFMASGHAVCWNGLTPVFADIDPHTFGMAAKSASAAMSGRCGAVMAVHPFGAPCDTDALAKVASDGGVALIIDAAPAFGATYRDGTHVGTKGLAEVFSLSPSKPFTSGEGGLITTDDGDLARELRTAREYGNPGDYDSVLVGLNGRMPELSAALARQNLPCLSEWLHQRRDLVDRYHTGLADLPGIEFQHVAPGGRSTYKDMCVTIDPRQFGLDRDKLVQALAYEQVSTRQYFDPPLHRQTAYRRFKAGSPPLPHSESVASRILSLPLFADLAHRTVDDICRVIHRIHQYGAEIAAVTAGGRS